MASERYWRKVEQPFASDGTSAGVVVVESARGFKVKAEVVVQSSTQGPITLQVKAIPNSTTIEVGPPSPSMEDRTDLSLLLVSEGAILSQPRQKRPSIGPGEIDRATYEEEPTVARRTILVDEYGNKFATDNPIPVRLSDGSIDIGTVNAELEVQLSHLDNDPDAGDVHDSVRIGGGQYEAGVDDRNRLQVVDEDARLVQRLQLAVANSNFLKLANYDAVVPSFRSGGMDLKYYESGALIANASIEYDGSQNWSVSLSAYINDADGSRLLDDDGTELFLD